jgi:hypothetical protein
MGKYWRSIKINTSKVQLSARISLFVILLSSFSYSAQAIDKKLIGVAAVAAGCCLCKWFTSTPKVEKLVIPESSVW